MRRRVERAAQAQPAEQRDEQRAGAGAGDPQQRPRPVRNLEHRFGEHPRQHLRGDRGHGAGEQPEHGVLGDEALDDHLRARAERAQQPGLADAVLYCYTRAGKYYIRTKSDGMVQGAKIRNNWTLPEVVDVTLSGGNGVLPYQKLFGEGK